MQTIFLFVALFGRALVAAAFVGKLADTLETAFTCARALDELCSATNSFEELHETWPQWTEAAAIPPPALSFFPDTTPAELGCVSRSLRFGRLLWCLARSPNVRTVLELFMGTGGGSTLLLAHALTRRDEAGWLYSLERDIRNIAHSKEALRSVGVKAIGGRHLAGPSGLSAAGSSELAAKPGAWLLHGDVLDHMGTFEALCQQTGGIDLVMLDPTSDLRSVWPELERACEPQFVVIHNANIRGHAGWIRQHLLRQPGGSWREAANGSHPSYWDDGARSWTIVCRELSQLVS